VERRLAPLVGPRALRDDQLLKTQLAYEAARIWATSLLEGENS